MSDNRFVVGVDGGGTRTTVALYDAGERSEPLTPIIRGDTEPTAVHPSHSDRSVERIEERVRALAEEADRALPARALVAGLAGAGREATRDDLQRALQNTRIATDLKIITDVRAGHYDAFEGNPGLFLVSGTGSIAYGQNDQGTTKRVGGWGPRLGDEGSGYDIALQGLRAVVKAEDGRGDDTRIRKAVLEKWGLDDVNALVQRIRQADRSDIADCAKEVLRVAEQGDEVAQEIAASAVEELSTHVLVLRDRLGPWDDPPEVAFHGGVISPGQPLFDEIKETVRELNCVPRTEPVGPARGAGKMALRLIDRKD